VIDPVQPAPFANSVNRFGKRKRRLRIASINHYPRGIEFGDPLVPGHEGNQISRA
jgi:hypothetical protein